MRGGYLLVGRLDDGLLERELSINDRMRVLQLRLLSLVSRLRDRVVRIRHRVLLLGQLHRGLDGIGLSRLLGIQQLVVRADGPDQRGQHVVQRAECATGRENQAGCCREHT